VRGSEHTTIVDENRWARGFSYGKEPHVNSIIETRSSCLPPQGKRNFGVVGNDKPPNTCFCNVK
jgi:hypothetical protein